MNEIVVLSGKGGTGKTSITASLAVLAGSDAVIADCDVDAANMHLLLNPDFETTNEFYSGELAVINQEQCTRCRKCEAACRFNAIGYADKKMQVIPIDCEGCGYCEIVCPTHAIFMLERKSGDVFISNTKAGSKMVHARLDIGAENSGKLVARVKNEAKLLAITGKKSFIIIDGAPGIGCPVVSSLAGANYVLLVTEPSMSGMHDLKRICAVIRKFRIKAGCIINKWDLNEEKTAGIKQFLQDEQIEHLADIPYDIRFTNTMSEGKTIVEVQSPYLELLDRVWNEIKSQLIK
jgi:MinD superfamily P-loop ATPase